MHTSLVTYVKNQITKVVFILATWSEPAVRLGYVTEMRLPRSLGRRCTGKGMCRVAYFAWTSIDLVISYWEAFNTNAINY